MYCHCERHRRHRAGSYVNTTGTVTATTPVALTGLDRNVQIGYFGPVPTLAKSFGANPQTIGVSQTATLSFTIDNTAAGAVNRTRCRLY
jgi:hypothetical protein